MGASSEKSRYVMWTVRKLRKLLEKLKEVDRPEVIRKDAIDWNRFGHMVVSNKPKSNTTKLGTSMSMIVAFVIVPTDLTTHPTDHFTTRLFPRSPICASVKSNTKN